MQAAEYPTQMGTINIAPAVLGRAKEYLDTAKVNTELLLSKLSPADQAIYHSLATEEQKRVYLERQQIYGSCTLSHQCIGAAWSAYLNNLHGTNLPPFPGYAVAHMLTIFKVLRAAKAFHEDNYVDGHNYFEFANCMQKVGA